jgi:hypothetical protein
LATDGTASSRGLTYAGIFTVALATLMLEILFTRITSVAAWYDLAFFVISLAMLGMTAGAVLVFLLPSWFDDARVPQRLAQSAFGFAVSTPVVTGLIMSVPLLPIRGLMDFMALLFYGGMMAVPFALGGVTLTLALTRAKLPASLAYGVDLLGAAAGCALVIPLLDRLDAPSAVLVSAGVSAIGACCFALAARAVRTVDGPAGSARPVVRAAIGALVLGVLGVANSSTEVPPLRPAFVKGSFENPHIYDVLAWNTYSRVSVTKPFDARPALWSRSRLLPPELLAPRTQRTIKIDGGATTGMYEHSDALDQHGYFDWDITSFAHHMRPSGPAAIVGVGGGRDVIVSARFGHSPIVGIELNDRIVDLHTNTMAEFSGLAKIPGVELVAAEARSYMVTETRRFSVIMMSLIDTWASTGAGSYSLSENGLYTVEAWQVFVDRLEDDGVFTVSRSYHPTSPGETARMIALGMEVLWQHGVHDPRKHLIVLQNYNPDELNIATLLLSPTPFSARDLDRMQAAAVKMGFTMLATPRRGPLHDGPLKQLWAVESRAELWNWARSQTLDLTPPTDDRPFFFNMLKPRAWLSDTKSVDKLDLSVLGNLRATQTLAYATLISLLLTLATVVGPLLRSWRSLRDISRGDLIAAMAYFALIGLGFMFVEIGLLARLSVFLGHPTVALAVLLGGIILFTGVGSLLSNRIEIERAGILARVYPVVPLGLVGVAVVASGPLSHAFVGGALGVRVTVALVTVAIPALGMGLGFPLGLRLIQRRRELDGGPDLGPWLWGINGAAGVCASGLALACSMVWGVPVTLGVGAGCYALLLACTWRLGR